jgi:molecular chaperone DnaK
MAMPVGIDIGTTNSRVAVVANGQVSILLDDAGEYSQPSVISFPAKGPPLVGFPAQALQATDPENTVHSFKRLLGRPFDSPEVRLARAAQCYNITSGPAGLPVVTVRGQPLAIPQLSAHMLRHMKGIAERRLGRPVTDAVITVPANFDELQREAMLVACQLARVNVTRIINEPTAAALAFGYNQGLSARVGIYDFGGGTFDFSILEIRGSVFRVLATGGDPYLGGDDFDLALATYVSNRVWQATRHQLNRQADVFQRLVRGCEHAKKALSFQPSARLLVPDVSYGPGGPIHLDMVVAQHELEEVTWPGVQRSFEVCQEVLKDAGLTPHSLDGVALVGGTTLMPLVRTAVARFFGKQPDTRMDPLSTVAAGAAIQAAIASPEPGDTHEASRSLLVDVASHSLGVEAAGGRFEPVIVRNTPVPSEHVRTFLTTVDGQATFCLRVFQGEAALVKDNLFLGELWVRDLPPRPAGQVSVEVTFALDVGGRLTLTARQLETGVVSVAQLRLASQHALVGGAA